MTGVDLLLTTFYMHDGDCRTAGIAIGVDFKKVVSQGGFELPASLRNYLEPQRDDLATNRQRRVAA
jgi:hypothetical protein